MDATMVAQVRRFNRTATQRVGALDDAFPARGRPLGEARVLWEIGPEGCEVRRLRSRLDLDSGYLSRLLRTLERDGLVVLEPAPADRRVRAVRLTPAGAAERAVLDRRADQLAGSVLASLGPGQRAGLGGAMAKVERLLVASAVKVTPRKPQQPYAHHWFEKALRADAPAPRWAVSLDERA